MGSGVNTSLLAGLGAGTALVAAGVIGASFLFPPAPRDLVQEAPAAAEQVQADMPVTQELDPPLQPDTTSPDSELTELPRAEEPAAETMADPVPEFATELDPDLARADPVPQPALEEEPDLTEVPPETPPLAAPRMSDENPVEPDALAEDAPPTPPAQESLSPQARLPSGRLPMPRTESGVSLPQVQLPPAPTPDATDPAISDDVAQSAEAEQITTQEQDSIALPGTRVSGLPLIGVGDPSPPDAGTVFAPEQAAISALERNSLYSGTSNGPKMALILNDPGLPMVMRRALAAIDFPFTVALNPLDSSAPEAAEIYNEAGKEVLILATSIPNGATATDLDVSFNAFFASLPMAVGVIDLPETGFGRNARLLGDVLPLLRQDGHALVTFSGGLAQAARAAEAAGVRHAEVFRVLDSGDDSAFTIRRFLDRAVFQASQIGEVIVFGDASNDVTMEAIEMWRSNSRLDQINLVPVSGILLDQ